MGNDDMTNRITYKEIRDMWDKNSDQVTLLRRDMNDEFKLLRQELGDEFKQLRSDDSLDREELSAVMQKVEDLCDLVGKHDTKIDGLETSQKMWGGIGAILVALGSTIAAFIGLSK